MLAAKSLVRFEKESRFSNLEVNAAIESSNMTEPDKALFTRLVYGVIERRITLDYIISQYSSRALSEIDLNTKISLRLGVYQLLFTDKIPDFASVSQTVDTAPARSRSFVNGLLRNFIRKNKAYSLPAKEKDKQEFLSVKFSVSNPICNILLDSYGFDMAEKILECSADRTRVCLRINTLKLTPDEAAERLSCDLSTRRSVLSDDILITDRLTNGIRSGIKEGLWFVQDEASRICTKVLSAEKGETTADVCAAPGGKTFSLAMDMQNTGKLYSYDLHENKLSLIRDGAERLGLNNIETERRDARAPDESLIGKCDRVLCDAPCSGLGVIAKKPEIRYKSIEDIERLPQIQSEILCGASKYVRKDGILVYSTCTLNKKENEEVAAQFLHENENFAKADFEIPGIGKSTNGNMTIFPHISNSDGFFIAKFRRIK